MKAWEAGYAVRWAQTPSFHRYLTGTTINSTAHGTYQQSMPWGNYSSNRLGNNHGTHTGTTDTSVSGFTYWLIPKYHGPACELKRCPVSNNNRYGVWLECNGQGTCDSNTGRCKCSYKWYMPNCAKKRCPKDPKTGKVCGGKGWCDSKTGLCQCNRDPAGGLEYPVDHYPWYAVTGTRWNNYGKTEVSSSQMLHSKAIVVTGSTGGLGKEIAMRPQREGIQGTRRL